MWDERYCSDYYEWSLYHCTVHFSWLLSAIPRPTNHLGMKERVRKEWANYIHCSTEERMVCGIDRPVMPAIALLLRCHQHQSGRDKIHFLLYLDALYSELLYFESVRYLGKHPIDVTIF